MRYRYLIAIVVAFALLAAFLNSRSEMEGWLSYEKGLEESKRTGKELFIFISSPTCPVCKDFRRFFTENRTAFEFISSRFVPVYIPDPLNAPVFVESVPKFCVGYENDLRCFYATSGDKLIEILRGGKLGS
ncbi:MAG: thioredoxin family protein [Archaeoglobaceae archaeon]